MQWVQVFWLEITSRTEKEVKSAKADSQAAAVTWTRGEEAALVTPLQASTCLKRRLLTRRCHSHPRREHSRALPYRNRALNIPQTPRTAVHRCSLFSWYKRIFEHDRSDRNTAARSPRIPKCMPVPANPHTHLW